MQLEVIRHPAGSSVNFYRPQRTPICHSVHRGWGWGCLADTPLVRHPQADTPRADTHPLQADTHPPADTPLGRLTRPHCSGRYASYWNAFLYLL